jgi:phenylacetaldehyde dehydrogenase
MGIAVSPQIHPQVAEFIDKPRKMLINGRWVNAASGKTFPTYNPATGDVLAQIAEGDREDINQAVSAARNAFDNGPWRRMTASERGRLIWKLADLLEQHTEEFGYLESLDNGKPLTIAKAADVPLAVDPFHTRPARSISPTLCENRLASSDKSSRGISRCSWQRGSLAPHWLLAARSF